MGLLSSLISFVDGLKAEALDVNSNNALIANAIPGTSNSINGSTAGVATAVCVCNNNGVIMTQIFLNGFRNGSAPAQNLTLPVPYLHCAQGWNGGIGIFSLLLSGTPKTMQQQTGFGAGGSGGTVSGQTTMHDNEMFHIDFAFDTISFAGSDFSTHTGTIFIVGS